MRKGISWIWNNQDGIESESDAQISISFGIGDHNSKDYICVVRLCVDIENEVALVSSSTILPTTGWDGYRKAYERAFEFVEFHGLSTEY